MADCCDNSRGRDALILDVVTQGQITGKNKLSPTARAEAMTEFRTKLIDGGFHEAQAFELTRQAFRQGVL